MSNVRSGLNHESRGRLAIQAGTGASKIGKTVPRRATRPPGRNWTQTSNSVVQGEAHALVTRVRRWSALSDDCFEYSYIKGKVEFLLRPLDFDVPPVPPPPLCFGRTVSSGTIPCADQVRRSLFPSVQTNQMSGYYPFGFIGPF